MSVAGEGAPSSGQFFEHLLQLMGGEKQPAKGSSEKNQHTATVTARPRARHEQSSELCWEMEGCRESLNFMLHAIFI